MAHHDEQPIKLDKKTLAKTMAEIDICMMTTVESNGQLHSRPMSNNSNVEWDGDSWFFAYEDSSQVQELEQNRQTSLAYVVLDQFIFISVEGRGEIVRDDAKKKELWYDELERWFPNGPEDDNVVLIKVVGEYAYYWGKEGDGQLDL